MISDFMRRFLDKNIMKGVELESISDRKEVSAGRTNTQIQGGSAEFNQLNEKISIYEIVNTKNTGTNVPKKENYDLLTLVIIKLGDAVYNGEKEDEGYELFRFLNAVMYPHKDDFLDVVSEYLFFGIGAAIAENKTDKKESWYKYEDICQKTYIRIPFCEI